METDSEQEDNRDSEEEEEEEEHEPDEAEIIRRIRRVIGDPNKVYKDKDRDRRVPIARHGYVHPFLPITAPDYSYVMDITDLRSLLAVKLFFKTGRRFEYQKRVRLNRRVPNAREPDDEGDVVVEDVDEPRDVAQVAHEISMVFTNAQNNFRINRGYHYLLTILDTTSRKAWAYPLKRKNKKEVYAAFQKFLGDIHGKIARLLSDNDKGFTSIMNNNKTFTYCVITASHNNHKTFGIIDRFTRTFRDLLYRFYCYHTDIATYSWYDAYKIILRTYNISKHRSLFLRGYRRSDPQHKKGLRKYYYSPDDVWYNPRLRSRIRLRMYFDGYKNYLPGTVYDKIKNADRVRIRQRSSGDHKGGESFFSEDAYKKGVKRGNAWFVNGDWYSYRNLWPYNEHEAHDEAAGITDDMSAREKTNRRDIERNKYNFKGAINEFMRDTAWAEKRKYKKKSNEKERRDSVRTTRNRALETGNLVMDADPDYAEEDEDPQSVGIRYAEEIKKNKNTPRYGLRESTKNPEHIHEITALLKGKKRKGKEDRVNIIIPANNKKERERVRELIREKEAKVPPEVIKEILAEAERVKAREEKVPPELMEEIQRIADIKNGRTYTGDISFVKVKHEGVPIPLVAVKIEKDNGEPDIVGFLEVKKEDGKRKTHKGGYLKRHRRKKYKKKRTKNKY